MDCLVWEEYNFIFIIVRYKIFFLNFFKELSSEYLYIKYVIIRPKITMNIINIT